MTEEIYTSMIQDLASKSANKEIEAAEFKARLVQSEQENGQLKARLTQIDAVFAANPELKELFDEAEKKMEVGNEVA